MELRHHFCGDLDTTERSRGRVSRLDVGQSQIVIEVVEPSFRTVDLLDVRHGGGGLLLLFVQDRVGGENFGEEVAD